MRPCPRGSHSIACWSAWTSSAPKPQVCPPSRERSSGTPATHRSLASSGETQSLPNHQPKVLCEDLSVALSGSRVPAPGGGGPPPLSSCQAPPPSVDLYTREPGPP